MTEEQWLACHKPSAMMDVIGASVSKRKSRLFACACCRRAWNPFVPPFAIRVVEAAEAYADGEVGEAAFARVREAAEAVHLRTVQTIDGFLYSAHVAQATAHACSANVRAVLLGTSIAATRAVSDSGIGIEATDARSSAEHRDEVEAQADLLRDIFGNPFQSVGIELEWLTETVLALTRGIYADRAFDRMPILADALQDAGCDDEEMLGHCRSEGEHVRGCWVVDLLLGKV